MLLQLPARYQVEIAGGIRAFYLFVALMSYLAARASFLQPYKGESPEQSRFAAGLATRLLCIPVNFQVQVQFFLFVAKPSGHLAPLIAQLSLWKG